MTKDQIKKLCLILMDMMEGRCYPEGFNKFRIENRYYRDEAALNYVVDFLDEYFNKKEEN